MPADVALNVCVVTVRSGLAVTSLRFQILTGSDWLQFKRLYWVTAEWTSLRPVYR